MNEHDKKDWIDWMSSNLNRNIAIVTKYIMAIANRKCDGDCWLL